MRLAALLSILLCAACHDDAVFACHAADQCGAGTCEPVGYCSFLDATCVHGRRYGGFAPPELADQCVGDVTLPDGGPDAAPGGTTISLVASADTMIDSSTPNQTAGSSTDLRTDASPLRFAMMRFDLSSIPAGATILSANLTVWTTTAGGLTMGSTDVYRLLEDWNEAKADWTNRDPGHNWTTAGAQSPGSRDASPIANFTPAANDTQYVVALPASVVQGWLASPGSNDGIVFVNRDTPNLSVILVSKEGADATKHPRLDVTYQP
jgi:hypothetical protein